MMMLVIGKVYLQDSREPKIKLIKSMYYILLCDVLQGKGCLFYAHAALCNQFEALGSWVRIFLTQFECFCWYYNLVCMKKKKIIEIDC